MKLVSIMCLVLVVAACGKSDSKSKKPTATKQVEALNGKSLDEVLSLKYSDITVECSLSESSTAHTFSWKLPAAKNEVRTVGTATYSIANIVLVDNLTYTNVAGEQFHMEFTPKVTINSSVHGFETDLVENTGSTSSTVVQADKTSTDVVDFRCALNTQIKPEYAHQFNKIK